MKKIICTIIAVIICLTAIAITASAEYTNIDNVREKLSEIKKDNPANDKRQIEEFAKEMSNEMSDELAEKIADKVVEILKRNDAAIPDISSVDLTDPIYNEPIQMLDDIDLNDIHAILIDTLRSYNQTLIQQLNPIPNDIDNEAINNALSNLSENDAFKLFIKAFEIPDEGNRSVLVEDSKADFKDIYKQIQIALEKEFGTEHAQKILESKLTEDMIDDIISSMADAKATIQQYTIIRYKLMLSQLLQEKDKINEQLNKTYC
jgi:hypothetical protein